MITEKEREYKRQYRQAHKAEISEYGKQYRQAHKAEKGEYEKQYRLLHKEEIVERKRQYNLLRKAEIREQQKQYCLLHKEERSEAARRYKARLKQGILTHYGNGKCAFVVFIKYATETKTVYIICSLSEYICQSISVTISIRI